MVHWVCLHTLCRKVWILPAKGRVFSRFPLQLLGTAPCKKKISGWRLVSTYFCCCPSPLSIMSSTWLLYSGYEMRPGVKSQVLITIFLKQLTMLSPCSLIHFNGLNWLNIHFFFSFHRFSFSILFTSALGPLWNSGVSHADEPADTCRESALHTHAALQTQAGYTRAHCIRAYA